MVLIDIADWSDLNGRSDVKRPKWFAFPNNFFEDTRYFDLQEYDRFVLIYLFTERSKAQGPFPLKAHQVAHFVGLGCTTKHVLESIGRLRREGIVGVEGQICTDLIEYDHTRTNLCLQDKTEQDKTEQNKTGQESPDNDPDMSANADSPTVAGIEEQEPKLEPSALVEIWNVHRGSLPSVSRMTSKRAKKIKSRFTEEPELGYWEIVVQKLAASSFATGKNDRGWKASFDWLVENDTNHVKVAEGKYDDREGDASKKKPLTLAERAAALDEELRLQRGDHL